MAFYDIATIDTVIDDVEKFVRNNLLRLLSLRQLNDDHRFHFFGSFEHDPVEFHFGDGDKLLLRRIVEHVQKIINELGVMKGVAYFQTPTEVKLTAVNDWYFVDSQFEAPGSSNEINDNASNNEPTSHTHVILKKLLDNADSNLNRPKGGFRFSRDIIEFAKYFRMLSGRFAYETLQSNLNLALPSISTVDRHIHRSNHNIIEGVLRCEELRIYLIERECELVVSISEDATRIDNRVQYDRSTNQLVGFVQPTDYRSGFPIPLTFKARTAAEIFHHFTSNSETAKFVNTIMAKPNGNTPAFCLLVYGTNGKNSARDVSNRWSTITEKLQEHGIKVLTISSDSDPRYNSAMKANSMLGQTNDIFPDVDWFSSRNASPPFYFQDTVHLGTKMRNHLLKTIGNSKKFPFGKIDTTELFIQVDHLKHLLSKFNKDQHCLTETTINPVDRQNFDSVLRICHPQVISLLEKHVPDSNATIVFLNIMRNSIDALTKAGIEPLERIELSWYPLFMVRIWRQYILSHSSYTLKDNFLSANCFTCFELNAHSLVLVLLYLEQIKQPSLFMPEIFNSQPCESFYRQIRSFTSTYSTVANCSVKEIINRISKIQLQSDISHSLRSVFNFPRCQKPETSTVPMLPSKEEIIAKIEYCKLAAISDAIKLNLIDSDSENVCACQVQPLIYY